MFWKVIATFALKQCIKLSFVSCLSRDTRGRRRIIAFLFYILVGICTWSFRCTLWLFVFWKVIALFAEGTMRIFTCRCFILPPLLPLLLFFLYAADIWACTLNRVLSIIHKWVVLCNIHWQGYDFFSGEARQTNEIIRTELEKIKRWPKPPLKVWKESLKLSRRIFDIHTLQR